MRMDEGRAGQVEVIAWGRLPAPHSPLTSDPRWQVKWLATTLYFYKYGYPESRVPLTREASLGERLVTAPPHPVPGGLAILPTPTHCP